MTGTRKRRYRVGDLVPGTRWFVRSLMPGGGQGELYGVHRNEKLPGFRGCMKILSPRRSTREQSEPLFVQELELLTRFEHDNIVRVIDFGTTADDSSPWFVMDLLKGPTLKQVIEEAKKMRLEDPAAMHPSLRPTKVFKIVDEICKGLHYAHTLKPPVVHRDIKAANIILRKMHEGSRAVILDFGIATVLDVVRGSDGVAGTPRYVSPEVIRGEPVTVKADLYALAILVYELLTLEFPYDLREERLDDDVVTREKERSVLEYAHLNRRPIPACQRVSLLPPSVDAALMRALSKEPADRQAHVVHFMMDLAGLNQMSAGKPIYASDPAVTDPDVRTPPGVRSTEGDDVAAWASGAVEGAPQVPELPASGHWLDIDRARWGAKPAGLPPAEPVLPVAPDNPRSGLAAERSDDSPGDRPIVPAAVPAPKTGGGSTPIDVRTWTVRVGRVAVVVAACGFAIAGVGWKRWTAIISKSPEHPAVVRPADTGLERGGMVSVPTFNVRVPDEDGWGVVGAPSSASVESLPPARVDGGRSPARPPARTAAKVDRARSGQDTPVGVDDLVYGGPPAVANVDDIVFGTSKPEAGGLRPGSGHDWPPAAAPGATSIARHP